MKLEQLLEQAEQRLNNWTSSRELQKAREYEAAHEEICAPYRPVYHLTPRIGWMNDPNGLGFYQGEYHLFYQYYPYRSVWGPMHWGHAKSKDLLHWEYAPAAMAPDQAYEDGCFSGSAVEQDGFQVLMYTSHQDNPVREVQSLAIGDGTNYVKFPGNPIITGEHLPRDGSTADFRDPKLWKQDGAFYAVMGNRFEENRGQVVLFRSENLSQWECLGAICTAPVGEMWECPDFFELDSEHVLIGSPMNVPKEETRFQGDCTTVYALGSFSLQPPCFAAASYDELDGGLDFYAPQTMKAPDGRRILIGWMKTWCGDWAGGSGKTPYGFAGMMTVPRELSVQNGKLCQQPIRELESMRKNLVEHSAVITEEQMLEGVCGRVIDLELEADLTQAESFTLKLAAGMGYETVLCYDCASQRLTYDRTKGGSDVAPGQIAANPARINRRCIHVALQQGKLRLRLLLDRYSMELFAHQGQRVMTCSCYAPQEAEQILFSAQGTAVLRLRKWDLNK